jgi:hypothetical protein
MWLGQSLRLAEVPKLFYYYREQDATFSLLLALSRAGHMGFSSGLSDLEPV